MTLRQPQPYSKRDGVHAPSFSKPPSSGHLRRTQKAITLTETTESTALEPIETDNTPEAQSPEAQSPEAQSLEAHGHEAHDHEAHGHAAHTHAPAPTLNPELLREIEVNADAETVTAAFRKVLKKYQKLARIPGFRVGKVPESVIKSRFAREVRQEVLESLVNDRFRAAIQDQNLSPISEPQVTGLLLEDGAPLHFKAAFEIAPQIDLPGYETVTIARPETTLTEAEFKSELDRTLEPHGTVEPIEEDRPIQDGDWAEIEFQGTIQPMAQTVGEEPAETQEPITGEDILIEVGGANTLSAFTDAVRGARPGQEMTFEFTYPQDFGEARLAGQTVSYDVKVKAMKRKTFPERDEDFAKQFGEFDTWEAFEADLRERTQARKTQALENQAKDALLGQLIARYPFPVPEFFVQQQIDARLDRGLRALAQQGMTADDMRKLDFHQLRAAQRDQAIAEVRASLLLDRLAELENIEVDEEELEREIMIASIRAREPMETTRTRLTEDGSLNRIQDQLRREKAGTALYERQAA